MTRSTHSPVSIPVRCMAVARIDPRGKLVEVADRGALVLHPVIPPVYRGVLRSAA